MDLEQFPDLPPFLAATLAAGQAPPARGAKPQVPQFANVVAALKHYFVNPSKRYAIHSVADPSARMEHLEELCPGATEKVADLFLRCAPPNGSASASQTGEESAPHLRSQKSLRLPLLAFLLQRWMFVTVKTWVPGVKFDEWCCRRREADKKVVTVVSPFFVDCEIWLTGRPDAHSVFHNIINPFKGRNTKGVAAKVLEEEHAILAVENSNHFLLGSWVATHKTLCSKVTKDIFSMTDSSALLRAAVKDAKRKVSRLYEFLCSPVFTGRTSHTKAVTDVYRSHQEVIFDASAFDLCGTAVFLAVKEKCESAVATKVLSLSQQNCSARALSLFHTDCLVYFNFTECKQTRTVALLDAFRYFLSMGNTSVSVTRVNNARSCVEPVQHSPRSISRVSYLTAVKQVQTLKKPDTISYRHCVSTCLGNGEVLENFRSCTSGTSGREKSRAADGFSNVARADVVGMEDYRKAVRILIPQSNDDSDLCAFLRSEEEKVAFVEMRSKLYPGEIADVSSPSP